MNGTESWDDIAPELRTDSEWREEAAEDERLAELLRRRRLSLGDMAVELVHRGDRATARVDGLVFAGLVIDAGRDFCTLRTQDARIDLNLERVALEVERQPEGGRGEVGAARTLKARLGEIAGSGEVVRVTTPDGLYEGVLLVASDHVEVDTATGPVLIPLRLIGAVIRPSRH